MDNKPIVLNLRLDGDMVFKASAGLAKVDDLIIDEANTDPSEMVGPNPSRLLGMAVAGCLSASLLFCIGKKKLKVDDFEAVAEVYVGRNEENYWRITKIDVRLIPKTGDQAVKKRIAECAKFFEKYCIVTESVRAGIEVNVDLEGP